MKGKRARSPLPTAEASGPSAVEPNPGGFIGDKPTLSEPKQMYYRSSAGNAHKRDESKKRSPWSMQKGPTPFPAPPPPAGG
ncbi:hypothetical protein QE152_g32299 [Popillia japonica]|uniref:Uncharacterized protein n=1 Tax=Popillia japonica TaxID=7064 RepID=A0AAW1IZG7_POPJA